MYWTEQSEIMWFVTIIIVVIPCHVLHTGSLPVPKKPNLAKILNQKLKTLGSSVPKLRRRGRSTKVKIMTPGKAGPMNPNYASSSSSSASDSSDVSNASMTNQDVAGVSELRAKSNDLGKFDL